MAYQQNDRRGSRDNRRDYERAGYRLNFDRNEERGNRGSDSNRSSDEGSRSARNPWTEFDGDDRDDRRSQERNWREHESNDDRGYFRGNERDDERWGSGRYDSNTNFGSRPEGDYYRGSMRGNDMNDDYIDWDRDRENRYSSNYASRGEDYGRMGSNYYSQNRTGSGYRGAENREYSDRGYADRDYSNRGSDRDRNEHWGRQEYSQQGYRPNRTEYDREDFRASDRSARNSGRWGSDHDRDYDDIYNGSESGRYGGRGNYGSSTNFGRGNYNSRNGSGNGNGYGRDNGTRRSGEGRPMSGNLEGRGERDPGLYNDDPNAWSSMDPSIYRRGSERYYGGGSNMTGDYGSSGEGYDFDDNFAADRRYSREGRGTTTGFTGEDHRGHRNHSAGR